jgi:hypothetical protein
VAGESRDSGGIPYSGIAGALLVVVAVAVQQTRLESARPAPSEANALLARSLHQDVEAHLWEDPLQAVAQFRDRKRQEAVREGQLRRTKKEVPASDPVPPDDTHNIEADLKAWLQLMMCAPEADDRHTVRLLMPMLMGERNEESAEMRRRTRYAVVSGLINAGYDPDDSNAIGYAYVPARLRKQIFVPETLPFEWFERPRADRLDKKEWVLVLWLDATIFQEDRPLRQFRRIVELLTPECGKAAPAVDRSKLDATVLGPIDSTMLDRLKSEIDLEIKAGPRVKPPSIPLRFVSASATGTLPGAQFFIGSSATTLTRVVGPDDRLVDALLAELRLRLKYLALDKKKPAVAVISEHDTDYGRNFMARLRDRDLAVEPFSYLRQIDGGKGGGQRRQKGADKEKDAEKSDTQQQSQSVVRAHGTSQIDYLERLSRSIERYAAEQDRDIVAIAIFGNDVYDKLLILRALRPAFPKAQFITTDMDARLLDPEELPWTRNLVLATNFGLTLGREVQRGTAPFRDGYQTASYFAAWLFGGNCALNVAERNGSEGRTPPWLDPPLLFEIGRHKAIPLAAYREGAVRVPGSGESDLRECKFSRLRLEKADAVRIQPSHKQPELDRLSGWIVISLAVGILILLGDWARRNPVALDPGLRASSTASARAFAIVLWAVLGCLLGGSAISWLAGHHSHEPFPFMLCGTLVAILLCAGLWQLNEGLSRGSLAKLRLGAFVAGTSLWVIVWVTIPAVVPNAEPFAWAEGVSVWPTQLLRALAVLIAGFSVWYIGSASVRDMRAIAARFKFAHSDSGPGIESRKSMAMLWTAYSENRTQRAGSAIASAIVYLFACILLIVVPTEARPGLPLRGDHTPEVATLLSFCVFLAIALLAGMMWGCCAFINDILAKARRTIPWFPRAAIAEFRAEHNLPHQGGRFRRFIDCCLSVELVAARSEWLSRLIYLPFGVFALMVVARSPLFDNWDTPVGLLIVLCLPFVMVIGMVLWLRHATLKFHLKAIRKAERELIRLRGDDGITEAQRWQLDKLFEKMRDEKRGAFQSIVLQPMVRALLLPLGGFSAIELLEQVVLAR